MHDLRFALRTLRKTPGFALVAILTLALGTGANTAIFSLIDAVLLRMLPVSHPEQLMFVSTHPVRSGAVLVSRTITISDFEYMARHAASISAIASAQPNTRIAVGVNGQPDRAAAYFVSSNFYSALGVAPMLGRVLNDADSGPDARVAVLSYAYWQRRFGGDPNIAGRPITINGVPFTVAGVTPREFYGLERDTPADVTVPLATQAQVQAGKTSAETPPRDAPAGNVIVRLKPGVNPAQAASELSALMRQAAMEDAGTNPTADRMQAIAKLGVELKPASQGTPFSRNQFDLPLKVLMGVVAVVMLIACANIANLLLAKSAARQREIAIRLSLGSTRWRLIRQLLTECAVLAAAGGALGLVFALWARDAIIRGAGVPNAGFEWNYRVFAFTAGVCLLNALLFGIAPALRATGIDFAAALKSSRIGSAVGRLTLGRALVAVQVALSLALVAGAGLFLSTFRNLDSVDLGYARDHALLVTIDPYLAGYRGTRIGEIYDQATQRIAALPGVRSVSTMRDRLMSGYLNMSNVSVPGYTPKRGEDPQNMWTIENLAGPHFFANAGMKLAAGRDFTEQDNQFSQHVAVINESMAQHFFGSENPIGRQFTAGRNTPPLEIVGVVHDIKYFNVQESKMDVFFTPSAQRAQAPLRVTLLVRSWGEPAALAGAVRAAIRGIDPSIPIYDVVTMDEQVRARLALERLLAVLSTFFGALALTLAAVGLYGVLSYGVSQRTSEIGIRMALGAQPRRLLAMILSETATLVIAGAAAGVGVAIGGARLVKQMLYGVTPTDKTTLAAAAGILLLAALVAALLPARRASRVDPMIALRHE